MQSILEGRDSTWGIAGWEIPPQQQWGCLGCPKSCGSFAAPRCWPAVSRHWIVCRWLWAPWKSFLFLWIKGKQTIFPCFTWSWLFGCDFASSSGSGSTPAPTKDVAVAAQHPVPYLWFAPSNTHCVNTAGWAPVCWPKRAQFQTMLQNLKWNKKKMSVALGEALIFSWASAFLWSFFNENMGFENFVCMKYLWEHCLTSWHKVDVSSSDIIYTSLLSQSSSIHYPYPKLGP